jgi:hypothetical protein
MALKKCQNMKEIVCFTHISVEVMSVWETGFCIMLCTYISHNVRFNILLHLYSKQICLQNMQITSQWVL